MPSNDEDRDPTTGDHAGVTMINVIEIPADQIDRFMACWKARAHIMSILPGFRDYELHQALLKESRFQLVNVARWDSREALEAAMTNPESLSRREAATLETDLDIKGNPALYRVVASDRRQKNAN